MKMSAVNAADGTTHKITFGGYSSFLRIVPARLMTYFSLISFASFRMSPAYFRFLLANSFL